MCGRYVITKAASKTKNIIQKNNGVADEINYNAFPGSVLPVITKEEDQLALHKFHWGLVPKWSEKMKDFKPLNNARLETIHEKVTFKGLIAARRCVVPADGIMNGEKMKMIEKFLIILREQIYKLYTLQVYIKKILIQNFQSLPQKPKAT